MIFGPLSGILLVAGAVCPAAPVIGRCSGIEVVITGLTRNQFAGNCTWVRIPPAAPSRGKLCIACPDFFQTSGRTHSTALLSPVWRARRSNFTILIQTRIIRTRFRSKMDPDDALFIRNTAAGHSAPPSQHQQPQDKIKPINTTSAGAAVLSARPPSPQQNPTPPA